MEVLQEIQEKEFYRQKIIEMTNEINNIHILKSVYIFVGDILKEDKEIAKQ